MGDFDWRSAVRRHVDERLKQHRDNLRLWESGYLDPTEPDKIEREAVRRELQASVIELELIEEFLSG